MYSSPISSASTEVLAKRRADATLPLTAEEVSQVVTMLAKLKSGEVLDLAKLAELCSMSRDRAPMLFSYLKSAPAYTVRFYNGANYVSNREVKP